MLRKFKRKLAMLLMGKLWQSFRTGLDVAAVPGCGGVAFLGDSLTHMARWELLFPTVAVRNYGIGGERSEDLLTRLEPIVRIQPTKLFLLIGTNDLAGGCSVDEIAGNVASILDALRRALPDCKLHLQSALPRQRKYAGRIRALNALYEELAKGRGIEFIDLFPAFDDGTGQLRKELTYDNLHLMGSGYGLWRDMIAAQVLDSR
ncbi:MAG: GDSL-type esterase/lipase family protein [Pseudomonadota bacterium]|nr:GDSL-type esterase/lipase family protein [Pseudomonadota bacterium]